MSVNRLLSDALERVAELEEERTDWKSYKAKLLAKLKYYISEDEQVIRDLEQQAKGLDNLHKEIENGGSSSLMTFILKEEADELRSQAKALKESK